jgi:hypothetical protein
MEPKIGTEHGKTSLSSFCIIYENSWWPDLKYALDDSVIYFNLHQLQRLFTSNTKWQCSLPSCPELSCKSNHTRLLFAETLHWQRSMASWNMERNVMYSEKTQFWERNWVVLSVLDRRYSYKIIFACVQRRNIPAIFVLSTTFNSMCYIYEEQEMRT